MARRKRGNGEGSVHKVKGKDLWRASIRRRQPDGTTKTESRYAKSKSDALALLRKMSVSSPSTRAGGDSTTPFSLAIERYLSRARVKPSTKHSYKAIARLHIIPRIGPAPTSRLTPQTIRGVIDAMAEDGASVSVQCHALTVIRQSLDLAVEDGVISINPGRMVKRPKREDPGITVWTAEQCLLLLEHCESHPHYPIFVAAIATGIRQGELLSLRLCDVDISKGTFVITRTVVQLGNEFIVGPPKSKSGKRTVTIPEFALGTIKAHIAKRRFSGAGDGDLLFPARTGQFIRRNNLNRLLKMLCLKAGLPVVRFHDLRHTSLTLLLGSGENAKVVQERAGHSRISTTLDIYGHVMPGMQERAAIRMNEVFNNERNSERRDNHRPSREADEGDSVSGQERA